MPNNLFFKQIGYESHLNKHDDPSEAVKEVLKQILDSDTSAKSGNIYGHSVGGITQIPKYTKEIIKKEILSDQR